MANSNVDCKRTFKLTSQKVSLTASILDKLKIGLDLSQEKVASLNDWTSYALARVYTECDLYRSISSGKDPAPDLVKTAYERYTSALDKLDAWVADAMTVLAKANQLLQTSPNTPTTDPKKQEAKKDVENTIDKHVEPDKKNHPTELKKPVVDTQKTATALLEDLKNIDTTELNFA